MLFLLRIAIAFYLALVSQLVFANSYSVINNADSGGGSLRQAILNLNSSTDSSNTISIAIPGTSTITTASDLPVIIKNVSIISTTIGQIIDGSATNRLLVTDQASVAVQGVNFRNGLSQGGIGANGTNYSGGGGGATGGGGGFYVAPGQTLSLENVTVANCSAIGGSGGNGTLASQYQAGGGGGASWTTGTKNAVGTTGGGDYAATGATGGAAISPSYGSNGYGGGAGGGSGSGANSSAGYGGAGGYCGGGGGGSLTRGGGGGNGGGNGDTSGGTVAGGGGGRSSGGAGGLTNTNTLGASGGGGGAFGGGGGGTGGSYNGAGGGGGFGGGGGGGGATYPAPGGAGGSYGGTGAAGSTITNVGGGGGGGAAFGGGGFVDDSAKLFIGNGVSFSANSVTGGAAGTGGTGATAGSALAPDIFLFRQASVEFNGDSDLTVDFSIQSDSNATGNNKDSGIIINKSGGIGKIILASTTNSFGGGTTVKAGTLQVGANNLPTAGSIQINSGAALNITSNFTLANTQSLINYGSVSVTGVSFTSLGAVTLVVNCSNNIPTFSAPNATIDLSAGSLAVTYSGGYIATGNYTLMTAANGNTIITPTVITQPTFNSNRIKSMAVAASGNKLILTVQRNGFNLDATSSLSTKVANFLEQVGSGSTTDTQNQLLNNLNIITDNTALNSSLVQVAPSVSGQVHAIHIHVAQQQEVATRIAALDNSYYSAGDYGPEHGVWLQPFFEAGKQKNLGDLLGYKASTTGFVLGGDKELSKNSILGIATSYARSKVKSLTNTVTHTDIDTYLGILYGSYNFGNDISIDWLASAGTNDYSDYRLVTTNVIAQSKHVSQQYSAQAIASKRLLYKNINVTPQASANLIYLRQHAYAETGADTLSLNVSSNNPTIFRLGIGARASMPQKINNYTYLPELSAMLYYDVKNGRQNMNSSFLTGGPTLNISPAAGRITAAIGAGVTFTIANDLELQANYNLQLKNKYYNNTAYLNLRYLF